MKSNTLTYDEAVIEKLANIKGLPEDNYLSKLTTEEHEFLSSQKLNIESFLTENRDFENYTEEIQNDLSAQLKGLYQTYIDTIRSMKGKIEFNGLEIKTITKLLTQNVKYDANSIFYGLHLKKNVLSELPTIKSDSETHIIEIDLTDSVTLQHILSTLTVTGLSKDSLAFANILFELGEVIQIYDHYDELSKTLNHVMGAWNIGLSADTGKSIENLVANAMMQEELAKEA